jgi:GTP-binding protein HflX
MITVYNKSDLIDPPVRYPRRGSQGRGAGTSPDENLWLSAKDPASISFLTEMIFEKLDAGTVEQDFLVPFSKGQVVSFLMENALILKTEYTGEGTLLTARCDRVVAEKAEKMIAGK